MYERAGQSFCLVERGAGTELGAISSASSNIRCSTALSQRQGPATRWSCTAPSDGSNHFRAGGLIPHLRHALGRVATPALHKRVPSKNPVMQLRREFVFMQPD